MRLFSLDVGAAVPARAALPSGAHPAQLCSTGITTDSPLQPEGKATCAAAPDGALTGQPCSIAKHVPGYGCVCTAGNTSQPGVLVPLVSPNANQVLQVRTSPALLLCTHAHVRVLSERCGVCMTTVCHNSAPFSASSTMGAPIGTACSCGAAAAITSVPWNWRKSTAPRRLFRPQRSSNTRALFRACSAALLLPSTVSLCLQALRVQTRPSPAPPRQQVHDCLWGCKVLATLVSFKTFNSYCPTLSTATSLRVATTAVRSS